jgi:AcrR family transcriptional regulator
VSAGEWVAAGLELLRREGEDALTIQRLCERLHRTKGSFYHHFADVTAFHEALLNAWEEQLTTAVIGAASGEADPSAFARLLAAAARRIDVRLELSVRSWALRSEHARQRVRRVDDRRLAVLSRIWADPAGDHAADYAALEYCAFLGAIQLFQSPGAAPAQRVEQLLGKALTKLARGRSR